MNNAKDNIPANMVEDIKQHGIDNLDSIRNGQEASELHHELYNMDYFIIGTYKAKEWLGSTAFDAIGIIQEYEESNFGGVNTDLSSPEAVCNMLAYITGEELLAECETLQNKWDEQLTDKDIDAITKELEEA